MTPDQIRRALENRPRTEELDKTIGWMVTPKTFGARQDGVTNDLTAHQAAQNAAQTNQTILITGPSVLFGGTINESGKYILRESTGPMAWPTATDANRAFPGNADGSAVMRSKKVFVTTDDAPMTGHMVFLSNRIKPTASPASYQKNGLFVIAITEDPSEGLFNGGTGTTIHRDAIGLDARGYIAGTCTAGRAWGINAYSYIQPGGEGLLRGIEVNVHHSASSPAGLDESFNKMGIFLTTKENAATAAVAVGKGAGVGWLKGYVVMANALAPGATSAFEYLDHWRVDEPGNMFVNKPTGSEAETGIALMQANGLAVFSRNANEGTTRFVRGGTLAGAANLWNHDTLGYSTAGAQRVFSRVQPAARVATDGAESGEIRFSTIMGGTLTEQMRIGHTGGVAVGAAAVAPGAGMVNISGNYRVNNLQVVGARRTGWAVATGTATRTTFDTAAVTLPQLAERVKALIDDLHNAAGHGLIGA
jgi:hypothetical protein